LSAPKYLGKTVEMKAAHRFEVARLERFLAGAIPGFSGPLAARQFEGGQSSPTYLLTTPDRKYVLRRKPPGVLLASAHAVDREFKVMSALFERGFPVPEPLVYSDDIEITGSPFYVMCHVEGRIFYDCRMPDLDPAMRAGVFDAVNETLAALHNFLPEEIGLGDFGRPGNYFARQVGRWSKQYQASETQDIPAMNRLIEWLPTAIPEGDETRIIHGDYSFHNVMIHPTEARVVGVVDWELSTTGHPLGDLMYNLMDWYRPEGVDERHTLATVDLKAMGIPTQDEYIARYFERRGQESPSNLGFYRAYNLFRVAAIVQGIAGRVRDGTATSANAGEQEARVPLLAEAAWLEAQRAGAV
jgi:aminoglycoside phosphotransferase (APT) family kinase protein